MLWSSHLQGDSSLVGKTNAIFVTSTYAPGQSVTGTWLRCSIHFNRFVGRLRRKIGNCEYVRVIERHKTHPYPHFHSLLLFPTLTFSVENSRYFDDRFYQLLQRQWTHGFSKFEPPRHSGYFPIGYILKYISKSTSANTLWHRLLNNSISDTPQEQPGDRYKIQPGTNVYYQVKFNSNPQCTIDDSLVNADFKLKKVKVLHWSRGFIEAFKNSYYQDT